MKVDVDFYPQEVEIFPEDIAFNLTVDSSNEEIDTAIRDDIANACVDERPTLIIRGGDIEEAIEAVRAAIIAQSKED
jgi:hypothetical protein